MIKNAVTGGTATIKNTTFKNFYKALKVFEKA